MATGSSRSRSPGAHEQTLADRGVRKGLGAYYTPADVVSGLLDLTLDPILAERVALGVDAAAAIRVVDPACGTGNFLVAAARRIEAALVALGVEGDQAAASAVGCVRGVELDAATARACRAVLREVHPSASGRSIRQGDALVDATLLPEGAFDLVIGNPPFLSQLSAATAHDTEAAARLRERFGELMSAYTDPSALFLVLGCRLARADGGVVAMIEPISVLTARDAAGVRDAGLADASLTDLWVLGDRVFDAAVEVCAPVLVRPGGVAASTRLHSGRDRAAGPLVPGPTPADASWSHLLADHDGLPRRSLVVDGVLGDLATATADFRDQYYGLAQHVVDQESADLGRPPLVTSGLIDPARLAWGQRTTRFNKTGYRHPRVVVADLDPKLQAWAASRLVPKVLVATQTRVPEAVVDETGSLLPSVPVISVFAPVADLWRIAAVLTCPAVALVAARRHLGSGRNARSIRLRATEVLDLPLPADRAAWDAAAALLAAGRGADGLEDHVDRLRQVGTLMDEAYGLVGDDELLEWWRERLPRGPR